ncbi:MAG: hypothetical protein KatS3mg031_0450 [Chitinophagales bacterium]|nr:MAG: hypothetical protein KatS3mg031_0450 [Chitinophagales bacterium]
MAATNSNRPITILLLISVVLNVIVLYFLYIKLTENNELDKKVAALQEKVDSLSMLRTELVAKVEETTSELDEFKGLSAELDSLLAEAKKDIARKEARIAQLKKDASKAKELAAEVAELKRLKERYLEQIDSLISANNLLKEEIVAYQTTLQDQTATIEQQKKTIEKGSILTADNVTASPQKRKASGKFVNTAIASKTNRVEICFDLLENKIAASGTKTIYLQILSPDGVVLGTDASGAGTFTIKDDNTQARYTATTQIDYQNQRKNYCVTWSYDIPLTKGSYTVKVFVDGFFSGVGAFILK